MKKLDLKHEPRLRRIAFLDWIGQLEIAFSSNKYTRDVLRDYGSISFLEFIFLLSKYYKPPKLPWVQ